MTSRGPQHRVAVDVMDASGTRIASATCFFSTWADDVGDTHWRGFLGTLQPEGVVAAGPARLRLASGEAVRVLITDVRIDGREQAAFSGEGEPPPVG